MPGRGVLLVSSIGPAEAAEMSEYARTKDAVGNLYQWVDSEQWMFVDSFTGEVDRLFPGNGAFGTFDEAIQIINTSNPACLRVILVRVPCIRKFEIAPPNG